MRGIAGRNGVSCSFALIPRRNLGERCEFLIAYNAGENDEVLRCDAAHHGVGTGANVNVPC